MLHNNQSFVSVLRYFDTLPSLDTFIMYNTFCCDYCINKWILMNLFLPINYLRLCCFLQLWRQLARSPHRDCLSSGEAALVHDRTIKLIGKLKCNSGCQKLSTRHWTYLSHVRSHQCDYVWHTSNIIRVRCCDKTKTVSYTMRVLVIGNKLSLEKYCLSILVVISYRKFDSQFPQSYVPVSKL